MFDMCLNETYNPQRFSLLWDELLNEIILGESTNMYSKTISKTYDVISKHKTPANGSRIPCNHVDVSISSRGYGNQTSLPVSGNNVVFHMDIMCYK